MARDLALTGLNTLELRFFPKPDKPRDEAEAGNLEFAMRAYWWLQLPTCLGLSLFMVSYHILLNRRGVLPTGTVG